MRREAGPRVIMGGGERSDVPKMGRMEFEHWKFRQPVRECLEAAVGDAEASTGNLGLWSGWRSLSRYLAGVERSGSWFKSVAVECLFRSAVAL